jgi:hypothetical protein
MGSDQAVNALTFKLDHSMGADHLAERLSDHPTLADAAVAGLDSRPRPLSPSEDIQALAAIGVDQSAV